jgi:riboflavin kinase/FMN adenylyltransferase
MHVYTALDQVNITTPTVVTIGKFNGMHVGHRYLLEQVVQRARAVDGSSMALTFDPHPSFVLHPQYERVYLAPEHERQDLIADAGIEHLLVLPFDQELAGWTAQAFMQRLCDRVHLRELMVGPEFRLGHRAHGTIDVLRQIGTELDFVVRTIEPLQIGGARVSATRVRELVQAGDVDQVPALLGRAFAVEGPVVSGDRRGRTIGFPTANVAVDGQHVLPTDGVYACRVTLPNGETHPAVTNVGVRPTFGLLQRTIEAHLLDWSGDLYDQVIRVAFIARVRGEQKFSGIDALKEQIGQDVQRAREVLGA